MCKRVSLLAWLITNWAVPPMRRQPGKVLWLPIRNSTTALDWLAKARIADGQFGAAIELLSSAPADGDEDLTLDLALAYSESGSFDKAADTLRAALVRSPGSLRISSALATVYVQSHRYQDATNLIRVTLNAHPNDVATQLLYLRLLVLQDDDADAQPLAQKCCPNTHRISTPFIFLCYRKR